MTEVQNRNTDLRTFRGPGCPAVGLFSKQTDARIFRRCFNDPIEDGDVIPAIAM